MPLDYKYFAQRAPSRSEFESWTIHNRHQFIKKEIREHRKKVATGVYGYIFCPEVDMCIRFKLNRKKDISCHEIYSMAEGEALAEQTALAVSGSNKMN